MDSRRRQLRIEVLDATNNRAATGMRVDVFTLGARARKICGGVVDADGVVDAPVLATAPLAGGEYEVVFHIGEYFRGHEPVPVSRVATAYVKSIEGRQTGQVYHVL